MIWQAYDSVKRKGGAGGVDGVSLKRFQENLEDNLYKVWNRMSSGSYFPPPVKAVSLPKKDGGTRTLGVPTVGDRVAQTVVAQFIEPKLEPLFHPDSYGYRPNKSALDAVGQVRQRCWEYKWVLEFDIRGFFQQHRPLPPDEGGEATHSRQVGPPLHRKMVKGPHELRRRDCSPHSRNGNASRFLYQSSSK